jgi:nucleoside-diphosphate-sugar epimerase
MDLVIAKDLAKGKIVYPGAMNLPHAMAYVPDLARTFVAVAEARARCAAFETLHFAGNTLTGQQMVDALTAAAKRAGLLTPTQSPVVSKLPWWAMRAGAWVVPMWRELLEMRYLWDVAHLLDESRLGKLLGQVPRTPLDAAMDGALVALGNAALSRNR